MIEELEQMARYQKVICKIVNRCYTLIDKVDRKTRDRGLTFL